MHRAACFLVFALAWACWAQEPTADEWAAHERTLREHNLPTEGAGLRKFFQDRTLSPEQIAQLSSKVEKLSSQVYAERVAAAADLIKAGQLAKPFLMDLIKNPEAELEAVRRAELCLRKLAEGNEAHLAVATAHLLAKHRPENAAAVLLDFVPFATDARIIEAVQQALNALAQKEGKPEPVLVQALKDPKARKRAAAGEALVRAGGLSHRDLVVPLLQDKVPQVRMQVAVALIEAHDKAALPALIQVLPDLTPEETWLAEDLLMRVAGEGAPEVPFDAKTPASKVRAAWQDWWQKNEASIDLAKLSQTAQLSGYTLITQMVPGAGINGRVLELGPNKEVHFKIDGLRYPVDARVIAKDRVLIAEYLSNRVTERDFQGNIVWEKPISLPIACQRLPSGQTFIATRRQLLVVDRSGKEVFTYFPPNITISAAQRMRNGHMVLVTSGGQLQWLDAQGKEVKSFPVGQVYTMGGNIDLLAGGRVLVPLYRENRVVEYDATGKVSWQANVPYPTSAVRLPNGNTLVVSMTNQRVIEINRDGKEVWNYQSEGRPWRPRRR